MARREGVLRISAQCVFLEDLGRNNNLLIWPASHTTWDAATAAIRFVRRNGELIVVRDGDRVALGGSGSPIPNWSEFVESVDWTSPPQAGCIASQSWSVGNVTMLKDDGT